MPIDSLFILTDSGTSLLEKNFRSDKVAKRSSFAVLTIFVNQLCNDPSFNRSDPIWKGPAGSVCVFIIRERLVFLCVLSEEEPPISALEFLIQLIEIIQIYISKLSAQSIKENFVTIYQLVSEMIDEGIIVVTDPSELQAIVPIPNLFHKLVGSVAGINLGQLSASRSATTNNQKQPALIKPFQNLSAHTSTAFQNSNSTTSSLQILPWRDNTSEHFGEDGIRYLKNEVYLDFVEKLNTTIHTNGKIASYEISGTIYCNSRLSGMPELKLILNKPSYLDDIGLHRCVRLNIFESSKTISFVPPDGSFKLATYSIKNDIASINPFIPIVLNIVKQPLGDISDATQSPSSTAVGLEVTVATNFNQFKEIQDVVVTLPLPHRSFNVDIRCSIGSYTIDAVSSIIEWKIGSVAEKAAKTNSIKLKLKYSQKPSTGDYIIYDKAKSAANVDFKAEGCSISGLKVDALKVQNLSKSVHKAVKYTVVAGSCGFRF